MAILSESDKAKYFPTVTLEGIALEGAIASLQAILEGASGANRPLEVAQFTEIKRLNVIAQTVQLSYVPVLTVPTPIVKARVSTAADWVTLGTDEYRIDETGRLVILSTAPAGSPTRSRWERHPGSNQWRFSEIWLQYYSGLDFSVDVFPISLLKAAAGQALTYLTTNHAFQGITSYESFQEYTVRYGTQALAGELPSAMLSIFQKYRPRR